MRFPSLKPHSHLPHPTIPTTSPSQQNHHPSTSTTQKPSNNHTHPYTSNQFLHPNHTQHATNTSEPIPFNTKPNIIIEFVDASKYSEPEINASKEATISFEILNPNTVNSEIQENIFTVSEIGEGFNKLVVEATTHKEEMKRVPDLITISAHVFDSVEEHKQNVINDIKIPFSARTTPSTEMKVVSTVVVVLQQRLYLTFELHVVPFHIFDPGGTLTVAVNPSVVRCRQIQSDRSIVTPLWERQRKGEAPQLTFLERKFCTYVFDPGEDERQCRSPMVISVQSSQPPTIVSSPAWVSSLGAASGWPWVPWSRKHKVTRRCIVVFDPGGDERRFHFPTPMSDTDFSFLCTSWEWDRGKNNWQLLNNVSGTGAISSLVCQSQELGLLRQFGLPIIRFGPKENKWVGFFNGQQAQMDYKTSESYQRRTKYFKLVLNFAATNFISFGFKLPLAA
jgi:hypothetical protein